MRIAFLTFGFWRPDGSSAARTATEAHQQTIELAEAAEQIGLDGAFLRVHHFAEQLSSPFPLLAAIGARTSRIELGTGVIDIRYESPAYMAELAATADVISGGRLQVGLGRGTPSHALDGPESFGFTRPEGQSESDWVHERLDSFRAAIAGKGVARAAPRNHQGQTGGSLMLAKTTDGESGYLPIHPQSPTLGDRIWWGSGSRESARWVAEQGMNLQTATVLKEDDTSRPFHELQAEMLIAYREAWKAAGWERAPRIAVGRNVVPVVDDLDRSHFPGDTPRDLGDRIAVLDGGVARYSRNYVGEPDVIAEELSRDAAVREADTLMLTIPAHLGVDYNVKLLQQIADHVAPALDWKPSVLPA